VLERGIKECERLGKLLAVVQYRVLNILMSTWQVDIGEWN